MKDKNTFYLTTAIAYPNAKPHIGHALEIIIADALARSYRLLGKDVVFQTGTDEHGVKNWRTAQKEGKEIHDFLNENVAGFYEMYEKLRVTYDTFLRTSDPQKHFPGAQELWKKMAAKGDIYKQSYEGLYCAGCESFKTEKDLVEGKCPDHPNGEIEKVIEENYFFKLSKYKDQVSELIRKDEYKIIPEARKNEMLAFLKDAKDVSFSRPKSSLPWGIDVPGDESQVMYVWCDALSNYLTGQGYGLNEAWKNVWPADLHIVGKDIQRFHAAFWPAMLISAEIALPKNLLSHGFLTLNGRKMGKSTGNTIDPMEPILLYGRDAVVFNLLYDVPLTDDGDFSMERLSGFYNSILIGAWGNLVNRVTTLSQKYGITSADAMNAPVWFDEMNLETLKKYVESYDLKKYLEEWYQLVQKANEYITIAEPWKKYKDEATKGEAIKDLQFLLYVVKNLTLLSAPILVDGFEKIQAIFGNEDLKKLTTETTVGWDAWEKAWEMKTFDVVLNPEIIYPRIEG